VTYRTEDGIETTTRERGRGRSERLQKRKQLTMMRRTRRRLNRESQQQRKKQKNYGYRWLNWWYPETGGAPFWTGVPEDLRKERQEQQEHLIDLEERMIQRRGVRADAKYGPNDYIKDYILDYVDEKGNRISPKE
jgi:hypothetical protein